MLKKYWPIFIILIIELILFATNYKPGTFLIGWDNLYPEFNIKLNLARTLFASWQEYRSLGLFDAMSHAANLPHDIFRMVLSWILPLHLVRWFFLFFIHFTGGVGMYLLLSRYVLKRYESGHPAGVRAVSLFGALFYQYNLITIQMFFLPFELFLIHYAALPFLIFHTLTYLESGRLKDLGVFFILSFLTSSQSHVPTIFIVYLLVTGLLFLAKIITEKKRALKRILILTLIIFCANVYWGLPFALSTLNNSSIVANSKNNQMATDDIFYRNLKFGDFPDVATLKGVSLDYVQYDYKINVSRFMMEPWLAHLLTPWFIIPSWLFFALVLVGLAGSLKRNRTVTLPFLLMFFFAFAMMANNTPVISLVSKVSREYLPLFHNIFRFVFTKFGFLYGFSYTIFLAIGISEIILFLHNSRIRAAFGMGFVILLILYVYPSFKGHFFYKNLASSVPQGYFSAFSFFQKQDQNKRVAVLPLPWYWAWTQNNWNTIGSGFIWYGIPQPLADRAFDPWSDKNENFYWELDQAIYSEDSQLLESVLNKYDVQWILFDKSVYHGAAPKVIPSRYEQLFSGSPRLRKVMSDDPIEIYSYDNPNKLKNFVSLKTNLPNIGPSYSYDNWDIASQEGGYVSDLSEIYTQYYPFRSLFSGKTQKDVQFQVEETRNALIFSAALDKRFSKQRLEIPFLFPDEFKIFNKDNLEAVTYYKPTIYLNNQQLLLNFDIANDKNTHTSIQLPPFDNGLLKISIPKEAVTLYDSNKGNLFASIQNTACSTNPAGVATLTKSMPSIPLTFTSINSYNCVNIDLYDLIDQRYGYLSLIDVVNENPHKGLFFGVINNTTRKTDLETYFDHDGKRHRYTIVINPRNYYGVGYSFNFNNISFGSEKVVNTLERFAVYRIPYYFLKQIRIVPSAQTFSIVERRTDIPDEVRHPSSNVYEIRNITPSTNARTLYLSQAFDQGWKAYYVESSIFDIRYSIKTYFPFLFGKEIKEHFVVSNWANRWGLDPRSQMSDVRYQGSDISDQASIIIVFWPQYLQFVGFGILLITAGVLFFAARRSS